MALTDRGGLMRDSRKLLEKNMPYWVFYYELIVTALEARNIMQEQRLRLLVWHQWGSRARSGLSLPHCEVRRPQLLRGHQIQRTGGPHDREAPRHDGVKRLGCSWTLLWNRKSAYHQIIWPHICHEDLATLWHSVFCHSDYNGSRQNNMQLYIK